MLLKNIKWILYLFSFPVSFDDNAMQLYHIELKSFSPRTQTIFAAWGSVTSVWRVVTQRREDVI